jgi:FtsP/CotA-like multicopper oxidase with cupredoxin domain
VRIAISILAISILVLAVAAQASVCPTTNVIEDPVDFLWTNEGGYWSGTLEIGAATLNIGGDTLTTRAYRQKGGNFSIPGPTIKVTPGETYVLTFENTLPHEEPSPVHNDLKDPNITNLHTHGLHVSGETPADDVTRLINGGYCGDYVYEVPPDHMGGTLWYHAHHHGSTYLQVAGGAFGLLLVDDSLDPGVPQGVADMTERQLAVGFLDPDVAGAGGDTLISGTLSPTWTVNGNVQGNLCTPADEWQHWRVLLADHDAKLKTLSVGPGCEVALLARDGVWRTTAPLDLPTNSIEITGASRADLAVRCSVDSTIEVNGTVVANVYADTGIAPNTSVGPYDNGATGGTWSADRPTYLRDLRAETQVENRNVNMGARTVNGAKFDGAVPTFEIPALGVQEWTIKGARQHPFHLHVYHVQMNGACGPFEDGEYYDTVAGSGCDVRFDLNPASSSVYDGRTIMHCHILLHEDEGAMGWADVQGGSPPPAFPDPGVQQALYQCGAPPVCTRNAPAFSMGGDQSIAADGSAVYTLDITNNDTAACVDSIFTPSILSETGDITSFAPSVLSAPTVTIPAGTTDTSVTLTVTGNGTGVDGDLLDSTVEVRDDVDHAGQEQTDTVQTTIAAQADCGDILDKGTCNATPTCEWSNRFKVCNPI